MKKAILLSLALMLACAAGAGDIPSGMTGLWRFQNTTDVLKATVGYDLTDSNPALSIWWSTRNTMIGVPLNAGLYADVGWFQDPSWEYLTVNPGLAASGGGTNVNEYTILWDVECRPNLNSLYQTSYGGNADDGDLWVDATTPTSATIGVDEVGFSANTFDATQLHRIVLSVKNGSFFRVYVDGTNYLEGAGQSVDGRFSLYPDRFHLFADNNWQDVWTSCGTVAVWKRALTAEEIAGMGGWIDGAAFPTELMFSEIPEIASVSPADGETNAAPDIAYQAIILDPAGKVDTGSIQLLLDGIPVTPIVMNSEAMVVVKFAAGGLLRGGSTHKYTLTGAASGGSLTYTNEVSFTVGKNYTNYEWRFTQGDLSPALGNGLMTYYGSAEGLTSFGTTDGSTVPHINGSSAKYMHVPGFTLDSDGYQLQFNDSGPNGGGAYINRYTLIFDMLVPTPWSLTWLVPYFNTEPYNLNDADFYLYGDGSIGTGAIYSAPEVVASNAWQRIAFVADLANSTISFYVNGSQVAVGSQGGSGLDGRWSLYSNQDSGPDLFLFNEGDTADIYTHELYVSSVAFTDHVLSAAELAGLGGPSADGILVPTPTLAIQTSGGGATISWPANCIGFALEQAESLASPQWKPVVGITNNAVVVPTSSAASFFRLVQ